MNTQLDIFPSSVSAVSTTSISTSSKTAKQELQEQILKCGDAARITVSAATDKADCALWFARQLGNMIASAPLSEKEKAGFVSSCYGQYVIAASLKPVIDADIFNAEVFKAIKAEIVA